MAYVFVMGTNISNVFSKRNRKLTARDKKNISEIGRQILTEDIEELEQRAYNLGLIVTARALNNAKNTSGWERAGNLKKAGLTSKGER